MMDGKARGEMDMLGRIVALLLALADLAERAAGRSYPVRLLVLSRLWQADAVVRDFVAGRALHASGEPPASVAVRSGADPAGAFALAASLRMLALIVRNMAVRFARASLPGHANRGGSMPHGIDTLVRALRNAVCPPPELRDTS